MPSGFQTFVSPDNESGTVTGRWADMSGSLTDVSVHIKPSGSCTFVIESSVDGTNAVISSPVLGSETVYVVPHNVPYHRVRVVTWINGTLWAKFGPIVARNREMGNVSAPIVRQGGPQ
jgi:hypothetical protein